MQTNQPTFRWGNLGPIALIAVVIGSYFVTNAIIDAQVQHAMLNIRSLGDLVETLQSLKALRAPVQWAFAGLVFAAVANALPILRKQR